MPHAYRLTSEIVAASVGAGVLCLAEGAIGQTFRLHARRPGAELNQRLDLPSGAAHVATAVPAAGLIRVDLMGPIEQRAGYHDPCSGWSDGHDAVCERLCAAFEQADVLFAICSPGGAFPGMFEGIDKAQRAKAANGRRVTVWANEQIGSAALCWALALGDELFLPRSGQVGSIGARGQHMSLAGKLEKDGIEVTHFFWPGDGKVAFAPERLASDETRRRGERDAAIAGEMFCEAVLASTIGQRYGLTRDTVVALNADVLTGQAAVDAGLADGVATEDEVVAYALKLAESKATEKAAGAASAKPQKQKLARSGARGGAMTIRADDEKDATADDAPPSSARPGKEPTAVCAKCQMQNEEDAKFCDQCGASMAAEPSGDDGPDEPDAEKPGAKLQVPARMSATADLTEILGLRTGASIPAQKAAALDLRYVFDYAARLTGENNGDRIVGGLMAMAEDAAASGRLRKERDTERKAVAQAERMDLAHRLAALSVPGHERGKVFIDEVNEDGTRKLDDEGNPILTLAPMYAEMRLGTLRGLVKGHEKNAPRRNPYEPNRAEAEAQSREALANGGVDKKARIERAKTDPAVLRMFSHPDNRRPLDVIAEAYIDALDQQRAAGG